MLELRNFGAAFGQKVVLGEISLEIPESGAVILLGPSGTGKSTLLRTLAGINYASPSFRTWGEAFYNGEILSDRERPELVAQSAQLMMSSILDNVVVNLFERSQLTRAQQRELATRLLKHAGLEELCSKLDDLVVSLPLALQRHIAVLRQVVARPRLLCIDEPTTGISNEEECTRLLTYLKEESTRRALLVTLHNQKHARFLGGTGILLAGGYIQEQQPIPDLFDAPISQAARDFARTGSCSVASPGTPSEELDDSLPPPKPLPKAAFHASSAAGPRGFLWLKRNQLAGTPKPGVFFEKEYDLKALQRVGVTTLITLLEDHLDETLLEPFGLKSIWEPIKDMHAPTIEQGKRICDLIEHLIADHEVVAVHCLAGMGRTGTILAAYLIWEGQSALDALETVRSIEPRWVQSQVQVDFLSAFEQALTEK